LILEFILIVQLNFNQNQFTESIPSKSIIVTAEPMIVSVYLLLLLILG